MEQMVRLLATRCLRSEADRPRLAHHGSVRERGSRVRQAALRCSYGVAARRFSVRGSPLVVAFEFKLPDLGEGLTEGEVARWLVSEGQEVAEDDPLVEIQTDKTTVEIPSPAAGKVARILVGEGEVVPVGTVLVVIGEDGTTPQGQSQGQTQGQSQGQSLAPAPR